MYEPTDSGWVRIGKATVWSSRTMRIDADVLSEILAYGHGKWNPKNEDEKHEKVISVEWESEPWQGPDISYGTRTTTKAHLTEEYERQGWFEIKHDDDGCLTEMRIQFERDVRMEDRP